MPKKDARTLVARFNEQIEPIYLLLRETEDINLSQDLLEPEPGEIPALKQRCVRACVRVTDFQISKTLFTSLHKHARLVCIGLDM